MTATANNTQRARLNKDDSRRVTHAIGIGDNKRYVATFELHAGWPSTLTGVVISNEELIDRSDKDVWDPKYTNVMRRWILPRSTHDMNSLLGVTGDFTREVHRFLPRIKISVPTGLSTEDKEAELTPSLFYRKSATDPIKKCDVSFRLLPDALGIYVGGTGPKLIDNIFSAGDTGTLFTLFLTAAIEAESRLISSTIDNNATLGSIPDISAVIDHGDSFQFEARAPSMGDYSTGGNRRILMEIPGSSGVVATTLSQYKSINDQSGLDQRVKDEYDFRNTVLDYGFAVIPWIETEYKIGDVIGSVVGRNIKLNAVIVNRLWSFENQTTTLRFTDERYR